METPVRSQRSASRAPARAGAVRAVWLAVGAAGLALLALLLVLPWMWLALFRALDAGPAPVAAAPPDLATPPPPRPEPVALAAADAEPDARPSESQAVEVPDDPGPGELESGEPEIVIVDDEEERNAPYVPQAVPYQGPTGMELFPPPGTKPLRVGIVVPDDFELPEGFVRHHQVSDDGEELPPVLAFHPDYEPTDADGNPIDPQDRIVPPDMAPEGLPIRLLELPQTEDPGT